VRLVVLVLVVIALLCAMALGAGVWQGESREGARIPDYSDNAIFGAIDRLPFLKSALDVRRIRGCVLAPCTLESFAGTLDFHVAETDERGVQEGFVRPAARHTVAMCIALSEDQLDECATEWDDETRALDKDSARLTVPKAGVMVRLYCHPSASQSCAVSVR
jgi:hypothetical protein